MSNEAGAQDVIVADNDYIIRDILRCVLAAKGFNVLLAVNGIEALDYATRTVARLVILDLKMPKLDGFLACAQLRRMPGYAEVPIAILSAFAGQQSRAAARHAGATAFLAKPFKPIDLLRAVAELLVDPAGVPAMSPESVWLRRQEPALLFGESASFSEGRRVLSICRR